MKEESGGACGWFTRRQNKRQRKGESGAQKVKVGKKKQKRDTEMELEWRMKIIWWMSPVLG